MVIKNDDFNQFSLSGYFKKEIVSHSFSYTWNELNTEKIYENYFCADFENLLVISYNNSETFKFKNYLNKKALIKNNSVSELLKEDSFNCTKTNAYKQTNINHVHHKSNIRHIKSILQSPKEFVNQIKNKMREVVDKINNKLKKE